MKLCEQGPNYLSKIKYRHCTIYYIYEQLLLPFGFYISDVSFWITGCDHFIWSQAQKNIQSCFTEKANNCLN